MKRKVLVTQLQKLFKHCIILSMLNYEWVATAQNYEWEMEREALSPVQGHGSIKTGGAIGCLTPLPSFL